MKAFQALAHGLKEHGVETIFGIMGDANMQIIAHYAGQLHGRFLGNTHEAGAVAAADGFHRMSGSLGVASVTHGPGLTNTVTALTEAARNRSQILVITGDTPPVRTWTQQIDIGAVVAPTGAGYERVYSAGSVADDLRRAIHRVRTERRPIVLNFPFEMLDGDAETPDRPLPTSATLESGALGDDALERALDMVVGSKRPLILAGRGAALSGARDQLIELADILGCPLATSLLGRDLFNGHPLNLGVCGSLSTGISTEVLMAADTLLVFGAGLNRHTTLGGDLTRGKRILQVDTDLTNVGLYTSVDYAVRGDAKAVAKDLCASLTSVDFEGTAWGRKYASRLEEWKPTDEFADTSSNGLVDARAAIVHLDHVLPADRTVVTDVGRFIMAAWRFMSVPHPSRFTHTSTFGSIGLGLGAAIGAAVADPDRLTVAIMGDGGFMITAAELSTAVRHQIPLLVVVLNDGAYGAEYTKLLGYGHDPSFSLVDWPDIGELAAAMGARSLTVRDLAELDVAPLIENLSGPALIDIRVDPTVDVGHW